MHHRDAPVPSWPIILTSSQRNRWVPYRTEDLLSNHFNFPKSNGRDSCNTAPGNRILSLVWLAELRGQLPVLGSRTFGSVARREPALRVQGLVLKHGVNESRVLGPNSLSLDIGFLMLRRTRSWCVVVTASEVVPMVKVSFHSALAKGSDDGKVLLHGEL